MLGLLFFLEQGCAQEPGPTGHWASHSFRLGAQHVLVESRVQEGQVAWVAVRNWPVSSGIVRHYEDTRITKNAPHGCCLIRRQNGELHPPDPEPHMYFFDGAELTTFRIRVREADIKSRSLAEVSSYADILAYFRRFEVGP